MNSQEVLVAVVVVGNGACDPSSKPDEGCLHLWVNSWAD